MDETREIFKLTFHFVENEYFTNKTLTKTYQCEPIGEHFPENLECNGITCDKIEWKEGKNVTVEYKKVKGKKSKEEPQESFFRWSRAQPAARSGWCWSSFHSEER